MKRTMLIGETGTGKSALIRALSREHFVSRRPMALEFCGQFINTPGEFLENRRFYHALVTTAVDCEILLMVQDATRTSSVFPPQFSSLFNRTVFGVITNMDASTANIERAERYLHTAGAREVYRVSIRSGEGLTALRQRLE